MRLADALGLPWQENFDPDSDEYAGLYSRLVDASMDFLRAGGRIALSDWHGFTHMEREAAARAGDRIQAVSSAMCGLAAQGHHAEVLAVADGGDAIISETLDRMLDAMEKA